MFDDRGWRGSSAGRVMLRGLESDLRSAAQTWQAIASAPVDSERMVYVAGCARRTPIGCEAASEPFFGTQVTRKFIRFFATRQGDGNVPWETGRLAGVRTWYLPDVEHGELAAAKAAFSAYLELLQTGKTTRLTDVPPVTQRAVEERFILAPDVPDCLPDQRELTATVIGAPRRKKRAAARLPKVKLSIRHGSLAYARYPVCVGHYQGDTIVSAEAYLDSVLGGRLHKRHQLDLYPGRRGTMEVILQLQATSLARRCDHHRPRPGWRTEPRSARVCLWARHVELRRTGRGMA